MTSYDALFDEIGSTLGQRFGDLALPFRLIGRVALELAGLPERGTRDVDALEEALRIQALSEGQLAEVEEFLKREFGKGSVGDRRHGLYLDLVPRGVAWLPPEPRFLDEKRYASIVVSRLHPADVCVAKTFSNFWRTGERKRDRSDIIEALDADLFSIEEYAQRLDQTLPHYEGHAEAPDVFPRVLSFLQQELLPHYGAPATSLHYELPSWMKNQ